MRKKTLLLYGLGLVVVFGAALSVTYFTLEKFSFSRHKSLSRYSAHAILHKIGLTPDQSKKLEPLEEQLKGDLDNVQLQMAEKRLTLCQLMNSSSTMENMNVYIDRIGTLQTQQQKLVVQHLLAMRDILTPDQRDQFFGAMMQDICQKCRLNLGKKGQECLCGRCPLNLDGSDS